MFHHDQFLCRAVCPELAGETLGLKEIVGARNRQRRALQAQVAERVAVVEALTAARRSEPRAVVTEVLAAPEPVPAGQRLKRYRNE